MSSLTFDSSLGGLPLTFEDTLGALDRIIFKLRVPGSRLYVLSQASDKEDVQ